ncbi:MAG: hypothetical protein IPL78_24210 [Chloroflexi bacterium]|nr:hypothetical protein [Chloroflexota bacterium]
MLSHCLIHHPPYHHDHSCLLSQSINRHAAASPPAFLRFTPIAKIPPHPLDPLPVPRVPFVSQVCQLAIMMAYAAVATLSQHNMPIAI